MFGIHWRQTVFVGFFDGSGLVALLHLVPAVLDRIILQGALQIRFMNAVAGGDFFQLGLLNCDVRFNAQGLNRTTRWRVVTCRGQAHRATTRNRDDRLHRTLTKALGAYQNGALVVLQCTRDDFRSRSRSAVDQDGNRLAVSLVTAFGEECLIFFLVATTG